MEKRPAAALRERLEKCLRRLQLSADEKEACPLLSQLQTDDTEMIAEKLTAHQKQLLEWIPNAELLNYMRDPRAGGAAIHRFVLHTDELSEWITDGIIQASANSPEGN